MFDDIFPVRHGGSSGKSEENRMLDSVGGPNTIRTKIVQTPEGELMLRTRGGFPEFTLTKKTAQNVVARTFVFRQIGSNLGVIANRFGTGMKVLVRNFVIGVVCYAVGALKSIQQGGWFDVLRINDLVVKLNGKAPTPVVATVPSYDTTALPYIAAYSASCVGDATRSPLFIAHNRAVSSIGTDGIEKSAVTVSGSGTHAAQSSAGIQYHSPGEFHFYGVTIDFALSEDTPWQATVAWSKILASADSPYLSEGDYANAVIALRASSATSADNFAVVYTHGATQSVGSGSNAPIVKPYKIGRSGMVAYYTGGLSLIHI